MKKPNEEPERILVKLLRELWHVERFATLADAADALKFRCARLRIRWTNDAISSALRMVVGC